MIERVINYLQKNGVERFVNTSLILERYAVKQRGIEWYYIEDVRSATFNAYGMSKISHRPVAVLVEEAYLTSSLTAVTEAWFQRVPLIMVTINSHNLESSSYLNRCVDASFLMETPEEAEAIIKKVLQCYGPSLIKIRGSVCVEEKIDYTQLYSVIDLLAKDSGVLCYNPVEIKDGYGVISSEYKYGIISKYVGLLVGGRAPLLCIPETLLSLDTNIYNFRGFPDSFKLIVKNTDGSYWRRLYPWLQNNNIHTFVVNGKQDYEDVSKIEPNYAVLVK